MDINIKQDLVEKFGIERAEEVAEMLKNFLEVSTMTWKNTETVTLSAIVFKMNVEGQEVFLSCGFDNSAT